MLPASRSVLFVFDKSPNREVASAVIFYRHLVRLEDSGWRINLVLHEGDLPNYAGRSSWNVLVMPLRRKWYPPFRPYGVLAAVRFRILLRELAPFVARQRPRVVVGHLQGAYFSEFAAWVSRKWKLPLGYFYHDATELFAAGGEVASFAMLKQRLIDAATIVWAISPPMITELPSAKARLLYPLSEDIPDVPVKKWTPELADSPVVVQAGTIYNETVEPLIRFAKALSQLDGRLVLFTGSTERANDVRSFAPENVDIQPIRPVAEVYRYVYDCATAMLLAYPSRVAAMSWIRTNFPSKFVQFTGVGVPTWIVAPPDSAVGQWASDRSYPGLIPTDDSADVAVALRMLVAEDLWEKTANTCRLWWKHEFSPDAIQSVFETDLEFLIRQRQ